MRPALAESPEMTMKTTMVIPPGGSMANPAWTVADAKAKFSGVIDQARESGRKVDL